MAQRSSGLSLILVSSGVATLVPATATACPPGAGGVIPTALGVTLFLALVTLGFTILNAMASWAVEQRFEPPLDRPSWWKTRIWAVGMLGWGVAIGLMKLVDLTAIESSTFFVRPIFTAFCITLPLVLQSAYVGWTWQRHGPGKSRD